MTKTYEISCTCGTVRLRLEGVPLVRGHCHCQACRILLNIPYHSVNAWNPEQVEVLSGGDAIALYQHPTLSMKKALCTSCGDVLYNTNKMDKRVVSQHMMARNNDGVVPPELTSQKHFFYGSRIVDVDDDLPKRD